ncbi:MAG: type II toxin-antitoxin system VapC family toxin [Elusimicrobia bacterium]|nr:type II toxin-antitoxin system VapC family toxin [Elusimicrobiota bacterium]
MNLILDPSVAIKWFLPEPHSQEAVSLKKWITREQVILSVPELFFSESANVLWKKATLKKEISFSLARSILLEILNFPFITILDRQVLPSAYDIASPYKITIYDAIYLACASNFHAQFITADMALCHRLETTSLSQLIIPLATWESRLKNYP